MCGLRADLNKNLGRQARTSYEYWRIHAYRKPHCGCLKCTTITPVSFWDQKGTLQFRFTQGTRRITLRCLTCTNNVRSHLFLALDVGWLHVAMLTINIYIERTVDVRHIYVMPTQITCGACEPPISKTYLKMIMKNSQLE